MSKLDELLSYVQGMKRIKMTRRHMESPDSWTQATNLINDTINEYGDGDYQFGSLAMLIETRLIEAGLMNKLPAVGMKVKMLPPEI